MKNYQQLARQTIANKNTMLLFLGTFILTILSMSIGADIVFPKKSYITFPILGFVIMIFIILFWLHHKEKKLENPRFKTDQAKIDAMADYLRRMDEIKDEEQKFLAEIEAP